MTPLHSSNHTYSAVAHGENTVCGAKNLMILLAQRSGIDNKLFEEVKNNVENISEDRRAMQEILSLEMFWIKIKYYPSDNNELKWSIEFDSASS